MCHVIHIFLDLLWVRCNCAKVHHCRICVRDFREGAFLQNIVIFFGKFEMFFGEDRLLYQ